MARLGMPPREILIWIMVPVTEDLETKSQIPNPAFLHVVIQREFVRVRPQSNGVGFVLALVIDKGLD